MGRRYRGLDVAALRDSIARCAALLPQKPELSPEERAAFVVPRLTLVLD